MNGSDLRADIEPYYLLRAAYALFDKQPDSLSPEEMNKVVFQANKEYELERRVLNSPEAASVMVTDQELTNAVKTISERFEDKDGYLQALEHNNLNPETLQNALLRQCKVENVLESVAARAGSISDIEVGVFYHMHPEKFRSPEQRSVSHILITINADYAENTREHALQRSNEILEKLKRKPHKFADLAMQHSECPSSLQGGALGTFPRGKLYPEIDEVLFSLKKDQLSELVETEAGFHIVLCTDIQYSECISLKKAQPKIRKLMQERSRRTCQKSWLASLPAGTVDNSKIERQDYD